MPIRVDLAGWFFDSVALGITLLRAVTIRQLKLFAIIERYGRPRIDWNYLLLFFWVWILLVLQILTLLIIPIPQHFRLSGPTEQRLHLITRNRGPGKRILLLLKRPHLTLWGESHRFTNDLGWFSIFHPMNFSRATLNLKQWLVLLFGAGILLVKTLDQTAFLLIYENLILFLFLFAHILKLIFTFILNLITLGRITSSAPLFFGPSFFACEGRLKVNVLIVVIRLGLIHLKRWRLFILVISHFLLFLILNFRLPVFVLEFLVPRVITGSIIDTIFRILILNHYINWFLTVVFRWFLGFFLPPRGSPKEILSYPTFLWNLLDGWRAGNAYFRIILCQILLLSPILLHLLLRFNLYCLDYNTINILIPEWVFLNLTSFLQQDWVDLQ